MRNGLITILLVTSVFAIFLQVADFEFITLDDSYYVFQNPHVQTGVSWENIKWAFHTDANTGNWHPITWISHQIDVSLFGLNAGAHHLTNVFFHLLNVLSLFLFLKNSTDRPWSSMLVALLFAIHPLRVESVAWISERKDVLSALFGMLTLLAYRRYVRGPNLKRYSLVFISLATGLMAKPMLVTVPVVLILLDFWPFGRIDRGNLTKLIVEKIPFFALSICSIAITLKAQSAGWAIKSLDSFPLQDRFANAMISYAGYIEKLVMPAQLSIFYPWKPARLMPWELTYSVLLLLFISLLVVRTAGRYPFLLVGWLWYVITLLPVIGIIQVGAQAMADRYTYIPFIGLFTMIVWGGAELKRWFGWSSNFVATIGILGITVLMTVSWQQTHYWRNSFTVFGHALHVTEKNPTVHINIGIAFDKAGYNDIAAYHYEKAFQLNPYNPVANNYMGVAKFRKGDLSISIGHFRAALKLWPEYKKAQENLHHVLSFRSTQGMTSGSTTTNF